MSMSMNSEEIEFSNDGKYRNFVSNVEKTLKAFEYSSEWADLISALGRLIKVLQQNAKFPVVPKKILVGKRLSQCLHPALPAGVHLKALECYDVIFRNIGPKRLSADLFVYCSGLFPLLGPSAMTVKPPLFDVYENHFLPLGPALKPAFVGMLQGLLPGLEEGAEYFDRCSVTLDRFCQAVEPSFFYTCMWQAMLHAPSVRQYGISYILNHFNRRVSTEDQLYIIGNSVSVMLSSLCNILGDSQVLVQRQALDFLLQALPVHNSQLAREDLKHLCSAALATLLRRDMSLNRRLYSWLLGAQLEPGALARQVSVEEGEPMEHPVLSGRFEVDNILQKKYFLRYSRDLLVHAVKDIIRHPVNVTGDRSATIRPFRIITTLMDKPEIGSHLIEAVLLDLMLYMQDEHSYLGQFTAEVASTPSGHRLAGSNLDPTKLKTVQEDFLLTANNFFANLESHFLWGFIARLFESVILRETTTQEVGKRVGPPIDTTLSLTQLCSLVRFILGRLPVETYSEVQSVHLPGLLSRLTELMLSRVENFSLSELDTLLATYRQIFAQIMQHAATAIDLDASASEVSSPSFPKREPMSDENSEFKSGPREARASLSSMDSGRTPVRDMRTMRSSIDNFREVFFRFCLSKLGLQKKQVLECMQQLRRDDLDSPNSTAGSDITADSGVWNFSRSAIGRDKLETGQSRLKPSMPAGEDCLLSLSEICRLLVDMASYPLCTSSADNLIGSFNQGAAERPISLDGVDNKKANIVTGDMEIPDWLSGLIVAACFVDHFRIKAIAVATLIELIHATRSVHGDGSSPSNLQNSSTARNMYSPDVSSLSPLSSPSTNQKPPSGGGMVVVVFPTLSPEVLYYLNYRTTFFTSMGMSLWSYLAAETPECHQKTVELFYELHQIAPSASVCEDIILSGMLAESSGRSLDAHRRFILLWHLVRGLKKKANGRTFDKCMFVLLDGLDTPEDGAVRAITQSWLQQALQTGECARILEPLVLTVLKPDTARVSLLHASVDCTQPTDVPVNMSANNARDLGRVAEGVAMEDEENRIYAISNEGGNVIFHVRPQTLQRTVESKYKPSVNPGKSPVRPVSLLIDQRGGNSRHGLSTPRDLSSDLPYERVNPDSVNLRINPFDDDKSSTASDIPPMVPRVGDLVPQKPTNDLTRIADARRLDRTTCLKEGILFDTGLDGVIDSSQLTNGITPDETDVTAKDIVEEILDEILDAVVPEDEEDSVIHSQIMSSNSLASRLEKKEDTPSHSITTQDATSTDPDEMVNHGPAPTRETPIQGDDRQLSVHPLHAHLLLYWERYDAAQVCYVLSRLRALLRACPRLFVTTLASTSLSGDRTVYCQLVQNLLARHRKALFGKNFFQDVTSEELAPYRNIMFLEMVITICSYYMRGIYPNLVATKLTNEDLYDNKKVQSMSAEVIDLILREVIQILRGEHQTPRNASSSTGAHNNSASGEKGTDLRSYIRDLCSKCKLERVVAHSLATSVLVMNHHRGIPAHNMDLTEQDIPILMSSIDEGVSVTAKTFSDNILRFNEECLDPHIRDGFQLVLLHLTLTAMELDAILYAEKGGSGGSGVVGAKKTNTYVPPRVERNLASVKFTPNLPLSQQSMLLSSLVAALSQTANRDMHQHWYYFVLSSLRFWGRSTSAVVVPVVTKLCKNVRLAADIYRQTSATMRLCEPLPADYCFTTLECLQGICHFYLLEGGHMTTPVLDAGSAGGADQSLLSSIFFTRGKDLSKDDWLGTNPIMEARQEILQLMPLILVSVAMLWQKATMSELRGDGAKKMDSTGQPSDAHPAWIMSQPRTIRSAILDLLSPLAVQHCICLLSSLAVVWYQYRSTAPLQPDGAIPPSEPDQVCLVDVCAALRMLPVDTLIANIREIVKKPPTFQLQRSSGSGSKDQAAVSTCNLQVSLLHFTYIYSSRLSSTQLGAVSGVLLGLLKDAVQVSLPPLGNFLLLKIGNEFVSKVPPFEDKKEQREVQELCQRLLETVAVVAGSSLEQPTWFRRGLQVKVSEEDEDYQVETNSLPYSRSEPSLKSAATDASLDSSSARVNTIQAIYLLAEHMASILDVIYKSEEKERVGPFLSSYILPNVFPYLRHHSMSNLGNTRACSQLLAALSSYQYTRRAWRKEVFDLYFESNFFQLDLPSLRSWRMVVDNLMTQDKNTFKEALTRLTVAQTGGLNLFTSKEAEYELRAACMKKLAFVLFSSEKDQYSRSVADLQERLTDCFRLGFVPQMWAQALLCFRVLIMRMSQHHLTSLWHIFVPELTHIFKMFLRDVSAETRQSRVDNRMLDLYLAACKLLDTVLLLPEDQVPQFAFYKWAFVGDRDACTEDKARYHELQPAFKPVITEISGLVVKHRSATENGTSALKVYQHDLISERPLFTLTRVNSLEELFPYLLTLSLRHDYNPEHRLTAWGLQLVPNMREERDYLSSREGKREAVLSLADSVEHIMELEFLESVPK